jgi:hypothetical protein
MSFDKTRFLLLSMSVNTCHCACPNVLPTVLLVGFVNFKNRYARPDHLARRCRPQFHVVHSTQRNTPGSEQKEAGQLALLLLLFPGGGRRNRVYMSILDRQAETTSPAIVCGAGRRPPAQSRSVSTRCAVSVGQNLSSIDIIHNSCLNNYS